MSQSMLFNIVFTGNIIDDFTLVNVKEKVGQLFKLGQSEVDNLFQGKPVTLKKNVDEAAAKKYKKILNQIGMVVQVNALSITQEVPMSSTYPSSSPLKPKESARVSSSTPCSEAPPDSVLASRSRVTASTSVGSSTFEPCFQHQPQASSLEHSLPSNQWTLDKSGAWLTEAKPRPDTRLQPPDFNVAPQKGYLLRPEELPEPTESAIDSSVLNSLLVYEPGEPLIPSAERQAVPQLSIDVSHLSLDPIEGFLNRDE